MAGISHIHTAVTLSEAREAEMSTISSRKHSAWLTSRSQCPLAI